MRNSEPLYFGSNERARAGWLHRGKPTARCGVVICNPFGYEAICAHRSLRRFAEAFAEAGIPTLRFDYDGAGDSAGDDRDPGRLDAWVQSARDAVKALRELSGVECVYFLGVRLGVLVATLAAVGQSDVAGIVAIAPVVAGRAYLRELSILQGTLGLSPSPDGVTIETLLGEGAQEAIGFAITKETRSAVGAVNLTKLDGPIGAGQPVEVLVLDRDDLPTADPWVARLTEQGVTVDARKVPGYVEMVLDPHKAIVPEAILVAAKDWLVARVGERERTGADLTDPRREATMGDVVEEVVYVDDAKHVFGVLSRPRSGRRSKLGILLLNAGAVHHVGPNRLYVAFARAWAEAGHEVLRVDITGIGDSPTRSGFEENVVYSDRAVQDAGLAVDFMRRRGATDVRTVGLCSGAYHSFRCAVVGQPITGFVAINPLCFNNAPKSNADFARVTVAREVDRYQGAARDPEKWKKLLRGEVRMRAAAKTLARHAASRVTTRLREVGRRLNLPLKDDVGIALRRIHERSVEQSFIFAKEDPGNKILRDVGGSIVGRYVAEGAIAISIVHGPDHTFTQVWSHEPLRQLLDRAISSRGDR